jgi:ribosome-binding protein aMBF1 (putative translation factor)
MLSEKLKRLQSAGWKVGSAKDFLQLRDEESALTELKLALTVAVRQSRQKRGLSQIDLAQRMRPATLASPRLKRVIPS